MPSPLTTHVPRLLPPRAAQHNLTAISSKASAGASKAKAAAKAVTKAAVGLEAKTKAKGLYGRVTGKAAAAKLEAGDETLVGMPNEGKPHGMPCL